MTVNGDLLLHAEDLLTANAGVEVENNLVADADGVDNDGDGEIDEEGETLPDYSPDGDPWSRKELKEMGFKGKVVSEYLKSFAEMIGVAEYLDAYNNGDSYGSVGDPWYDPQVGPGHADG